MTKRQPDLLAWEFVNSDRHHQMTWANTRKRDLERLIQGFAESVEAATMGTGTPEYMADQRDSVIACVEHVFERAIAINQERQRQNTPVGMDRVSGQASGKGS
ncbi:MAG: hypothetical protein RJQ08_11075 [Salinisphaeraceae bacterium]